MNSEMASFLHEIYAKWHQWHLVDLEMQPSPETFLYVTTLVTTPHCLYIIITHLPSPTEAKMCLPTNLSFSPLYITPFFAHHAHLYLYQDMLRTDPSGLTAFEPL